ncbi:FAD-binding oxidoreductase [Aliiglaciecola sp. CAU 1673]|uniref:NAD(P)/FAD-dependent oxidoreductase n=1 Tax=Aliiglaciecola sp. CAU 1673 TaxID=3032595 RepID=UPI0023DC6FDF|nr:FAD-binding oxidoreductase [Aliiglaciecola sp. CAU 1673]MDF2178516.1 FAD-binding oxidoreductase [Aliiglaciecola sp. CAU 1673]
MFDPLVDKACGEAQPYPASYWSATTSPVAYAPASGHQQVEVAIIGGGYTGLSCAYHLASEQGIAPILLEANQVGWGCSGRNAGFVLNGTGRLSFAQMHHKWGAQVADNIYREYRQGIDTVETLIKEGDIQCDRGHEGYLKVAHNPSMASTIKEQADWLRQHHQDPVEFINKDRLKQEFLNGAEAHGALYFPYCFGLHPLKLALGYARMAADAGAKLHSDSPVLRIEKSGAKHRLITPQAEIIADKLVIATNGYTVNRFHKAIDSRHFPVLSSIIVTQPLTSAQQEAIGLIPGRVVMDTRALKYYYRLLPDGRLLFGGRGAIKGKDANHPLYQNRLLSALLDGFPQLKGVTVDYFWSGWVSVSFDDYPRICAAEDNVFYSMGYCGSGVSFASQAGKRLAERVAGKAPECALPFFQSPLPKFPFSPFRRLGLWGFYHWGRLKDAL